MDENDVTNFLKLFVLLYADDTIIFAESPTKLQLGLTKMKEYCDLWKLKLNAHKSKIVIFSRGKVRKFPNFTLGEDTIEVVSNMQYLGLNLNYNNRMNIAQKDLYDRALRAMFALLKKCKNLNLPLDVVLDLFDKTVIPILTYGCEIWGFEQCDILQRLQLKFYKIVMRLRVSTPSMMVFGEAGHYPVSISVKARMLSFWFKLISYDNRHKISSLVYRLLFNLYNNGIHESVYLKCIRSCLIEVGMPNLWHDQDVSSINITWFKSVTKQCFKDQFIQTWYSHIDNDSVLTNYRLFKTSLKQEPFIYLLPTNCAIEVTRFRTGNNYLPVNVLRYQGVMRHERVCTKCDLGDIGDEFHYLFVCPFFYNKRYELLPSYYTRNPNTFKYNELFNSENRTLLLKLKRFIIIINRELK